MKTTVLMPQKQATAANPNANWHNHTQLEQAKSQQFRIDLNQWPPAITEPQLYGLFIHFSHMKFRFLDLLQIHSNDLNCTSWKTLKAVSHLFLNTFAFLFFQI